MGEVDDTVVEAVFVVQLQLGSQVAGQRSLASTDDDRADGDDRADEDAAVVEQVGPEGLRREVRAAHRCE
jgi:hypothetical protein